ncbi:Hypothetical protein, putative [Bodo saltans]|uniref:Uncharacterized protein n=1 Tax=Bodo saltans TaxID=75058 RepID=A0A0S4J1J7_BODSA|nr:Hypothetical protein, putative [Bodo saltans]|eukprot:CUG57903.1 Hypothetical protein, putative [Bodo saltans]
MSARGSGSEFSAVARVLFDNAAKSGIITGDSRKQFAKQLQRLATQSKRNGGSLADVSMRMSEFVSRESSAAELQTATQGLNRQAMLKGIPSLNVPSLKQRDDAADRKRGPQTVGASPDSTAAAAASAGLGLNLHLPGLRKKPLFTSPSNPPVSNTIVRSQTVPAEPKQPLKPSLVSVPKPPLSTLSSTLAFDEPLPNLQPQGESPTAADRKPSTRSFVAIDAEDSVFGMESSATSSSFASSIETSSVSDRLVEAPKVVIREAAASAPTVTPSQPPPLATKKPARQRFVATDALQDATTTPTFQAPTSSFSSSPDATVPSSLFSTLNPSSSTSIDEWELQREQEINQLQAAQREHEEKLAAAAEAERLRLLGEEWAIQRYVPTSKSPSSDPFLPHNEKIFFASQWSAVEKAFEDACAVAARDSVAVPDYTLVHVIYRLRRWHTREERKPIMDSLRDRVRPLKNGQASLELLDAMDAPPNHTDSSSAATKSRTKPSYIGGGALPEPSVVQRMRSMEHATWEQVLSLYSEGVASNEYTSGLSKSNRRSRCVLEKVACESLVKIRRQLTRDQRYNIAMQLLAEVRKQTPVIDRPTASLFAKLLRGRQALQILTPIDSPDADEKILSEHIRYSTDDDIAILLTTAQKLGFNLRDPAVVEALAGRQLHPDSSDPMKVFAMIAEQQNDGVALTKTHVHIALLAANRADPKDPSTREFAVAALKVVNDPSRPSGYQEASVVCRRLFPILYSMGMLDEIFQLYKRFEPTIDFAKHLPNEALFVNSAVKVRGLPPLSEGDASSLPPREIFMPASAAGGGAAGHEDAPIGSAQDTANRKSSSSLRSTPPPGASLTQATLDSIISTDSMLEYAKENNWVAALGLLQRLPSRIPPSQESTAVLLYNCAMSAASQVAPLVDDIFAQMKLRKDVRPNSTTYNTVMNSFARSDTQWNRAIELYATMEPQLRDASTFSVQLSLLGKYSLWEQAIDVWSEAKAAPIGKPSAALYSLGIQALHKHSWSHTLAIFQELLKTHGVTSVKEVVALRVMKSLEDNKKFTEAQKVEHQLEKLRSKGKGKKK